MDSFEKSNETETENSDVDETEIQINSVFHPLPFL
jgi:hypothetical protein